MPKLNTAIAATRLFADSQKIALLVHLDELSEAEKDALTQAIEEFDVAYRQAFAKLKDVLEGELAGILVDPDFGRSEDTTKAVSRIRQGLRVLQG